MQTGRHNACLDKHAYEKNVVSLLLCLLVSGQGIARGSAAIRGSWKGTPETPSGSPEIVMNIGESARGISVALDAPRNVPGIVLPAGV